MISARLILQLTRTYALLQGRYEEKRLLYAHQRGYSVMPSVLECKNHPGTVDVDIVRRVLVMEQDTCRQAMKEIYKWEMSLKTKTIPSSKIELDKLGK